MAKIEEKAMAFATALTDVYRDEENRELEAVRKMNLSEDVTEDFTAMLIAMRMIFMKITRTKDSDIIDFTHILNKLAVQWVMEGVKGNEHE